MLAASGGCSLGSVGDGMVVGAADWAVRCALTVRSLTGGHTRTVRSLTGSVLATRARCGEDLVGSLFSEVGSLFSEVGSLFSGTP